MPGDAPIPVYSISSFLDSILKAPINCKPIGSFAERKPALAGLHDERPGASVNPISEIVVSWKNALSPQHSRAISLIWPKKSA